MSSPIRERLRVPLASVSQRRIRKAVNDAEDTFEHCFSLLASWKYHSVGEGFTSLQARLAATLLVLAEAYNDLAGRQRELIGKKERLDRRWFLDRQRQLSELRSVVRSTTQVGKAIGDAFAWFWYQHEPELLRQHLMCPPQVLHPTGHGGRGEVAFAQNIKAREGHLVVHHSVTSMLRLGDVSVVDLRDFSVAGLGELKSKPTDGGMYRVHLELLADPEAAIASAGSAAGDRLEKEGLLEPLSQPIQARLERQRDRMKGYFNRRVDKAPDGNIDRPMETGFDAVGSIIAEAMRTSSTASGTVFPGLLAIVIPRSPRASLFTRQTRKPDVDLLLPQAILDAVSSLIVPNRDDNRLLLEFAVYTAEGAPDVRLGGLHPFWWPIPADQLEPLFLQRAWLLTVYNPAHLFLRLEAEGFEVDFEENEFDPVLTGSPDGAGRHGRVTGLVHYIDLIRTRFISPAAVVQLLVEAGQTLSNLESENGPTALSLSLNQVIGRGGRDPAAGAGTDLEAVVRRATEAED